jgi:hypothetical protein
MTGLHGTYPVAVRIRIILPYTDPYSGPADPDLRPHPTNRCNIFSFCCEFDLYNGSGRVNKTKTISLGHLLKMINKFAAIKLLLVNF